MVIDYSQVEPLPPHVESTTTVTQGATERVISSPSKRTPQIYRQCWSLLRQEIERGTIMRTRQGILNRMEAIEKQVRG